MRQNTLEMHMKSHRRNDEYEEMKALFTFPIHPRAEDKENKRRILSLLLKKKKKILVGLFNCYSAKDIELVDEYSKLLCGKQ